MHILEGSRVVRQVVETVPPEPQLDEQETAGAIKLSRFLIAEAAVPNRCACAFDVCAATTTTKAPAIRRA